MTMAQIASHNASVLSHLEDGDMVEFKRGIYSHWAVYVGNRRVVHLAGRGNNRLNSKPGHSFSICGIHFDKAEVKQDDFDVVTQNSRAYKNNGKDETLRPFDRRTIVKRALSKVGNITYNILWSNCEHFASWCRYDVEWSEQANSFFKWAAVGTIAAVGVGMIFGSGKKEDKRTQ